jgi:hypothetical protein
MFDDAASWREDRTWGVLVMAAGVDHAAGRAPGRWAAVTRVRLDLGGAEIEFDAVLHAMRGALDVLLKVQGEVLGPKARGVRWVVVGLRDGSAIAELEARPDRDDVDDDLLGRVADAYVRGIRQWADDPSLPPPYFDYDAVEGLRGLAAALRRYGTGPLTAVHLDAPTQPQGSVQPMEFEVLGPEVPEAQRSPGSVIGRIDAINLHDRREATLYDEVDRARVVLTFGEDLVERVRLALRHRVEASGEVAEDDDGRPLRMYLEELDVLPSDDELPRLADLVGRFPDLTGGQDPSDWLREQRREGEHG